MKTKITLPNRTATESATDIPNGQRPHSIRYYYSSAGVICSGHTVAFGKTKSEALSAFFLSNPNVRRAA